MENDQPPTGPVLRPNRGMACMRGLERRLPVAKTSRRSWASWVRPTAKADPWRVSPAVAACRSGLTSVSGMKRYEGSPGARLRSPVAPANALSSKVRHSPLPALVSPRVSMARVLRAAQRSIYLSEREPRLSDPSAWSCSSRGTSNAPSSGCSSHLGLAIRGRACGPSTNEPIGDSTGASLECHEHQGPPCFHFATGLWPG